MNDHLHDEILEDIKSIEKNEALYNNNNYILRSQAIDDIDFHIIDRIDAVLETGDRSEHWTVLKQHAQQLKLALEDANANMFKGFRNAISQGGYRGQDLLNLINEHVGLSPADDEEGTKGYDEPDVFINQLLTNQLPPIETREREAEMVYYQKTPVSVVLELVKKARFKPGDVFFDLGSGLGQATILVHLLAGVLSKGIEFEPALCSYATTCAADLHLKNVAFINTDARIADYTEGTVFFMYTPFHGDIMEAVLQKLKEEANKRPIKIFTYGPCVAQVVQEDWLTKMNESQNYSEQFALFISI